MGKPRRNTRGLVAGLTVGALWLVCPRAGVAGTNDALARKHFNQAELHYQQGEFRKALAQYKKAQSFKRHPALIFNIAQCHRQLGEYKKALFFYRLFLAELPGASNKSEVEAFIRQMEQKVRELDRAARNIGRVTVITRPRGAEVRVDGITGPPAAVTPAVITLKAGQHVVVVSLKGYRTVHRTANVPVGGMALLNLTLEPVVKPRPVETRRRPPVRPVVRRVGRPARPVPARKITSRPEKPLPAKVTRTKPYYRRWWFWTGLGVGVVMGLGGAVMGVTALKSQDKWEKYYRPEDKRTGEKQRLGADILIFSAAGIGLTTVIAAIVVGYGKKKEIPARTSVVPSCGAGSCGLMVRGQW